LIPLDKIRRALFIRLRSLGDTVLFTPALHNFKRACPHCELFVLADEHSAQILKGNPDVDEIVVSPRKGARLASLRFAYGLMRRGFDLVVDFHGGPRAAIATGLSRAKWRVGWADRPFRFVYNLRVPRAREALGTSSRIHTVAKNLALIKWIGVPIESTRLALYVDDAAASAVRAKLKQAGAVSKRPLLLVHIGATKKRKEYPPERFARLLSMLAGQTRMQPVILGAEEDQPRWGQISGYLPEAVRASLVSLVGKLSLAEVIALCKTAKGFVGADNGIMHIADALGTPSVVLFGKTELRLWHPWQSPHIIVRPCANSDCSTCPHSKLAEGCLALVGEDHILQAVQQIEALPTRSD